jgi:hypothetical protein
MSRCHNLENIIIKPCIAHRHETLSSFNLNQRPRLMKEDEQRIEEKVIKTNLGADGISPRIFDSPSNRKTRYIIEMYSIKYHSVRHSGITSLKPLPFGQSQSGRERTLKLFHSIVICQSTEMWNRERRV